MKHKPVKARVMNGGYQVRDEDGEYKRVGLTQVVRLGDRVITVHLVKVNGEYVKCTADELAVALNKAAAEAQRRYDEEQKRKYDE